MEIKFWQENNMFNVAILVIFYFLILIYSIIIHEVAHGVMALWLGDNTAKYSGRISLNPFKHIDPWMTIMVPFLMLLMTGGRLAFGGAKPVPYNPYNLRNQKWGPALVAFAGPASNILFAIFFAIGAKLISIPAAIKIDIINNVRLADWEAIAEVIPGSVGSILFAFFIMAIFWNILLAVFNLIPIPPLDGSKLLFSILPIKIETMAIMEQFGFIFLLIFILLFPGPLSFLLNFFWLLFFNLAI
jgi:Zn-dependent protease